MSDITLNLISAAAISIVITLMSKVSSQKAKALLYSLPIPITIALIGSRGVASSLSISGLIITTGFLWGCYYLHTKRDWNILHADVFLSLLYVVVAYFLAKYLRISLWPVLSIYLLAWLSLITLFKRLTFTFRSVKPAATNIWLKALFIFVIAFLLFSAHQYLAAFVVTFPYNGVFAVYENRFGLYPQAALFTRNSIALAAYFVANYLAGHHVSNVMRYLCSWLAFGVVLVTVNQLIRIRVESA